MILADSAQRPRSVTARYLRSAGIDVLEASTVRETCELLETANPDLLALDADLEVSAATPNGDAKGVLRALVRRTAVENPKLVLTCRSTTPRSRLTDLMSDLVSGVILLPCRSEIIIERLGRVFRGEVTADPGSPAAAVDLTPPVVVCPNNSSLLQQSLLCRFHDTPVATRRFALRQNRVVIEPNFFDIPTYVQPVGSADYVDYHRVCVTVCPKCLFASPDPSYFLFPGSPQHVVRQLTPSARYAIMSRAPQRRELVGDITDEFFSEYRSAVDAIKSYELAVHCSGAMHGAARRSLSDEQLREGNYHLRIAHLQRQLGAAQKEQDAHVATADRILNDAFSDLIEAAAGAVSGPTGGLAETGTLARNLYQCLATAIYQNDDFAAHAHLSTLARLRTQVKAPATLATIDRYLGRSAKAYQDREQHRKPTATVLPFHAPFLTAA